MKVSGKVPDDNSLGKLFSMLCSGGEHKMAAPRQAYKIWRGFATFVVSINFLSPAKMLFKHNDFVW